MINPDVFKAYDIRGIAGSEITPELSAQVGRGLAELLPDGIVAVGYDMRPESEEYAKSLMSGLVIQGRKVWNLGLIPTDMIYFAVGKYELAGGAVVTASHNPGQYNGIKIVGAEIAELRDAVLEGEFTQVDQPGSIEQKDLKQNWVEHALGFVDAEKWPAFNVAIDASNGMAGLVLPLVKTPLNITELCFELDGTFPNHAPNPVDPQNLKQLIQAIKSDKLDFGIAFDGDGDRAVLVDNKGRMLNGNIMTAIIAADVLAKHPGATIVYSAAMSNVVPETVEKLGGKAVRVPVGHANFERAMREHGAEFGGEYSGHLYFKDNYYAGSGLIGALKVVDILAAGEKTLAELYDVYNMYPNSGEINLPVADVAAAIDKLASTYEDGTQDRLDGLTVRYADWWFNARPSNTEPLLRLSIEANDQDLLQTHQQELLGLLDR
jgi:phosphomannomutase